MVDDGQHRGEDGEQGEDDHKDDHQPRVCKCDNRLYLYLWMCFNSRHHTNVDLCLGLIYVVPIE